MRLSDFTVDCCCDEGPRMVLCTRPKSHEGDHAGLMFTWPQKEVELPKMPDEVFVLQPLSAPDTLPLAPLRTVPSSVSLRFWDFVHNCFAHPLMGLFFWAKWPVTFHDFTSKRMRP